MVYLGMRDARARRARRHLRSSIWTGGLGRPSLRRGDLHWAGCRESRPDPNRAWLLPVDRVNRPCFWFDNADKDRHQDHPYA